MAIAAKTENTRTRKLRSLYGVATHVWICLLLSWLCIYVCMDVCIYVYIAMYVCIAMFMCMYVCVRIAMSVWRDKGSI